MRAAHTSVALLLILLAPIAGWAGGGDAASIRDILSDSAAAVDSIAVIDSVQVAFLSAGDARSYFLRSSDICHLQGYQGETVLGIFLDASWQITQVIIVNSEDTPRFVRRVNRASFLRQFIHPALENVRAVSGATFTSEAIKETVKQVKEWIQEQCNKGVILLKS